MKSTQLKNRAIASALLLVIVISIVSSLALASASAPQPRYIAVHNMTCDFDIGILGISNPAGSVTLRNGYTAELKVTIMQSSDTSHWTSHKYWTTNGSSYLSLNEYYAVVRGYFYKAVAGVTVYDSNGNPVEYVELDSPYQYY